MGRLPTKSDYENLRNARILENHTRLSTLGLNKTLSELSSVALSAKSTKPHIRNHTKQVYGTAPLRRSDRLRKITSETTTETPKNTKLLRSARLGAKHCQVPISGRKNCVVKKSAQPCIGKTDCSACHSTNSVLCRACLKVRYGEELEVRQRKKWICPHCIEETGTNPYWICNSSLCLKKRKMAPTGIAIFRAKEMGSKSVAHLLMDELQKAIKC